MIEIDGYRFEDEGRTVTQTIRSKSWGMIEKACEADSIDWDKFWDRQYMAFQSELSRASAKYYSKQYPNPMLGDISD